MALSGPALAGWAIAVSLSAAANAASLQDSLFQALDRTCPQSRWRHATMSAYEQPLAEAAHGLSAAQTRALDASAREACRNVAFGMACDNSGRIRYLAKIGRTGAMVRAFCAIKPDTFD